jgi:hypothetical protein
MQEKIDKLENGTHTARWAACTIKELLARLAEVSILLHSDVQFEYDILEQMRAIADKKEVTCDKINCCSRA